MTRIASLVLLLVACWLYTADTRLDPSNGDPYVYLHAAQTFRRGDDLRNPHFDDPRAQAIAGPADGLMTAWPPLYPILLALIGGTLDSARILNAVGLWFTLWLGWVFLRRSDVPASVTLGTLMAFVILMGDAQRTLTQAAVETVFWPVLMAWLIVLPCEDNRSLAAASVLGACLGLLRYIGMPLVAVSVVWVMYRRGFVGGLAYSVAPGLLYGAWLMRNYGAIGRLTGHTLPSENSFEHAMQAMGNVLWLWTLLIIACGGGLFCLAWFWRRGLRSIWRVSWWRN